MPLDIISELEKVLAAFEADGIEYALCGGLALAVHGHPRFTQDIDFLVQEVQLPAALSAVKSAGFDIPARKMTFGLRTATPREIQRTSKLEDDTGQLVSVDLLVVAHEYVEVWASRIRLPWRGRQIVVVSRDGLAKMKRLAGRPIDLRDIDVLEGNDQSDEDPTGE